MHQGNAEEVRSSAGGEGEGKLTAETRRPQRGKGFNHKEHKEHREAQPQPKTL